MIHYIIGYYEKSKRVEMAAIFASVDPQEFSFKDAEVKENHNTGRVYLVDAEDTSKEFASLPLNNTTIITYYGE